MLHSKMTLLMKPAGRIALCLMIWQLSAQPSHAQNRTLFIPFEAGQGVMFREGVDAYTFSAQIHPSLGLWGEQKRLQVGGSLAAAYTNPKWEILWGGRISLRMLKIVKDPVAGPLIRLGAIHLVGKGLWNKDGLSRATGGVLIEVGDGIFQLSPQWGYDYNQNKKFMEVSLGTDLALVTRLMKRQPSN